MPEIVLTTFNAKFAHASFGLRYLFANMRELRSRAEILEFEISQRTVDVLEAILARSPRLVALGVYIWNIDQSTQLVAELKRVRPDILVVLGGPEVSYECEQQAIVQMADCVITGEADLTFPRVCQDLLDGRTLSSRIIPAELPQFRQLHLPYAEYTDLDVAQRVIYVEASRGCPFECEFCLSSLDIPVRQADLDEFLNAMQRLLDRGLNQFKFVDRTFNLNVRVSGAILDFFWERYRPGLFLHFEMIPDRLPAGLRERICRFPPGALQFEVGIQTLNADVAQLISRRQDVAEIERNLRFLRSETGVHVHADLIVGLPGETLESFALGFDRLVEMGPQEIQVGMLKRLRGTPIVRHDDAWGMVYSPHAPYEILQTRLIDFPTMQRLRRFARYWDLVSNSGNFVESTAWLWTRPAADRLSEQFHSFGTSDAGPASPATPAAAQQSASPCLSFLQWSDWLYQASGRTNGIALKRLAELLFQYLVEVGHAPAAVAEVVWRDYQRGGRSDLPPFLRPHLPSDVQASVRRDIAARHELAAHRVETNPQSVRTALPRQARHAR